MKGCSLCGLPSSEEVLSGKFIVEPYPDIELRCVDIYLITEEHGDQCVLRIPWRQAEELGFEMVKAAFEAAPPEDRPVIGSFQIPKPGEWPDV